MCDECTWHYKTFLMQSVYWHLAIKLYCNLYCKPPPAKIVLSTCICHMSGKDDVSFVYFRMGYSFPVGRLGEWPDFQSFFWLAGNVCSCFPGSMLDQGFISVNVSSTPSLQERPDKTVSQISKHCCMLSLGIPMVKQTILPFFFPVPLSSFWLWSGSTQLNFFFAHFTTKFLSEL